MDQKVFAGNRAPYIDKDDPSYNEKKTLKAATEASSVNYADLFGW